MRSLIFTPGAFDDVSRAVVDRFPYHVYFVADDRMVRVIVVFHTARSPRALLNRLKQH